MREKSERDVMNAAYEAIDKEIYLRGDPVATIRKVAEKPGATTADIEVCAIWLAMSDVKRAANIATFAPMLMKLCEWRPGDYVKFGEFYDIPDKGKWLTSTTLKMFKDVNHRLRAAYSKTPSIADIVAKEKADLRHDLFPALCKLFAPARMGTQAKTSCRRINTLLRWMVREDWADIGVWHTGAVRPSDLYAVLGPMVARQAAWLGHVTHNPRTWPAVLELTQVYRSWDAKDPLKYDLVLSTNNFIK